MIIDHLPAAFSPLECETKYELCTTAVDLLHRHLSALSAPDSDFPDAFVHSIYYDTPDLALLREKVNSDYQKLKVRVRWYEDASTGALSSSAFAEVKLKFGSRRTKARLPLAEAPAVFAAAGFDGELLAAVPGMLAAEGLLASSGGLRPVLQISYRRRRFAEPHSGIRIALDAGIHCPRVDFRLVPAALSMALRVAVLEVKGGDGTLPGALAALAAHGLRKSSFSKYLACWLRMRQDWQTQ